MLRLSLNELKLIGENKGIKDYKSMSEDELLSVLNLSELVKKSEKNLYDTKLRIKKTKKTNELGDRFSKAKIKEIRKNLYETENKKIYIFMPRRREIEKILLELENNLFEV